MVVGPFAGTPDILAELAEVEIPSWVPASDRLNQFLDWPLNVPKPRMNPFNIGKIMADEALIEFMSRRKSAFEDRDY